MGVVVMLVLEDSEGAYSRPAALLELPGLPEIGDTVVFRSGTAAGADTQVVVQERIFDARLHYVRLICLSEADVDSLPPLSALSPQGRPS